MDQWVHRTNARETCFRPDISQRKIFFMGMKSLQCPLHRQWRKVWFSSRDERVLQVRAAPGKCSLRMSTGWSSRNLQLQFFKPELWAWVCSFCIVGPDWDNWWDADIGWQPGLQWLQIYHSLALVKTTWEFRLVAVKRERTWHFLPPKCLSCFKAGNVKPLWQPAGSDFTWNNA